MRLAVLGSQSLDELEALQGGVVKASTAHDQFEMEYSERAKLFGNAFHTELVRALFSEMSPPSVSERSGSIHAMQAGKQRKEETEAQRKEEKEAQRKEEKEARKNPRDKAARRSSISVNGSRSTDSVPQRHSATRTT